MEIKLEVPESIDELGNGIVSTALQQQIEVIWNTILGCVYMGDIASIEHLTNTAANIAEENIKECHRRLRG